jgi:hypothetical protein
MVDEQGFTIVNKRKNDDITFLVADPPDRRTLVAFVPLIFCNKTSNMLYSTKLRSLEETMPQERCKTERGEIAFYVASLPTKF